MAYWFFKSLRGLAPDYLAKKFERRSEIHNRDTRNKNKIDIPGYRTVLGQRTFHYRAVSLWNALPERLTKITNIWAFKKELMRYLEFVLVSSLFLRQDYLLFLSS